MHCYLIQSAIAQDKNVMDRKVPIIEVDSITGMANSTIPFDEAFFLKIRVDETPSFIVEKLIRKRRSGLMQIRREVERGDSTTTKCIEYNRQIQAIDGRVSESATRIKAAQSLLVKTKDQDSSLVLLDTIQDIKQKRSLARDSASVLRSKRDKCHGAWTLPAIPESRLTWTKENGRKYLLIAFVEVQDRVPPNKDLAIILMNTRGEGYSIIRDWHSGNKGKAMAQALKLRDNEQARLGIPFSMPDPTKLDKIANDVGPDIVLSDSIEARIARLSGTIEQLKLNDRLDALLKYALRDTLKSTEACLVDCNLIKEIQALRALDLASLEQFFRAERSLTGPSKISSILGRTEANKGLSSSLNRMLAYQTAMSILSFSPADSVLLQHLKKVDLITAKLDSIKDVRDRVSKNMGPNFSDLKEVGGSTSVYDFKTRSAFQTTPDFGLVVYGPMKGQFRLTPYFGAQFNLRKTKKSIPWCGYPNKTWYSLHHLSFSVGYTATKLAEEGQRDDLFSKASLMTGVGWRFAGALRVTGGALWFYAKEPNPALSGRTLSALPYLGLSVDIDLASYMNDFVSLFK